MTMVIIRFGKGKQEYLIHCLVLLNANNEL